MTANIVITKQTKYEISFANPKVFEYNDTFRKIRDRHKYKCKECFACNHSFNDGEQIGIIATNRGNKVVCKDCAEKFLRELISEGKYKKESNANI